MATGSAPSVTGDETGNHGETVSDLLNAAPSTNEYLPCRRDPDLWFAEKPSDLERAKRLCGDCPIRSECLAGALSRGEPWGVWGGEIVEQGTVINRKKPRGRPRKHPVEDTGAGRNSTNGRRVA
ncbi:WhiB family redox-sensing transcriptional regulator [Actinopolyspora biskrensis]|uniref:Transcriptional regulator WhiB n=1 Tax=Actinopolyspora biskrensis TaxID=1470178 RepID=A0A852Z2N9_9ACTN|nr:WhiB family transcriptional regulator [Actinopolyspora biskrensis]NYH80029.1 WhiB family redox-sensing transcriptional regulator [Actinopolyspora biskrensis]